MLRNTQRTFSLIGEPKLGSAKHDSIFLQTPSDILLSWAELIRPVDELRFQLRQISKYTTTYRGQ